MTADDLNASLRLPPDTWVLDYRPSHALAAQAGDVQRQALQATMGPAFTLIHRRRVAAIWGLVIPWPGLAEGWMAANPDALRPIAAPFTYGARRFCRLAHERLGLRRIQVHVPIANVAFQDWARAARFRVEATLPCFWIDGGDVVLMSRIYREKE